MSEHVKKLIKKIVFIFCLSFAGMFALLYIFTQVIGKNSYSNYDAKQEQLPEEDTASGEETAKNNSAEKPEEPDPLTKAWGIQITPKAKMDFRKVLWEDNYRYFNGKEVNSNLDELFSFAYPKTLFYKVKVLADDDQGKYSVTFQGNENDALLLYSQEKHKKGRQTDELLDELYQADTEELADAGTLYHGKTVYVVDGFENSNGLEIYKVVKTDEHNIYTMLIKTPVPEKEEDKTFVEYYTEYLYRSCGFSGSSKEPRSYSKYLLGVNE